jgi:hypothetical protein
MSIERVWLVDCDNCLEERPLSRVGSADMAASSAADDGWMVDPSVLCPKCRAKCYPSSAKEAAMAEVVEALNTRLDRVYKLSADILQRPHSREELDVVAHRLMDAAGLPSWLPGSSPARLAALPAAHKEKPCARPWQETTNHDAHPHDKPCSGISDCEGPKP